MDDQKGLVRAYVLDGKGGGRKITWPEIRTWTPDKGALWVHFDYTHPDAKEWLFHESGLDEVTCIAMTADETRPRCVIKDETLMVFLRGINQNPGQDPEEMVSIRIWVNHERIITAQHRPVLSINDICHDLDFHIGPTDPTDFFIQINNRLSDRIGVVINDVEAEMDRLEDDMLTGESHKVRWHLAEVRRDAIIMRRYLAPQREVLYRLHLDGTKWFDVNELTHLLENIDRVIRYIEDLDLVRDRAVVAQEELSSRLSEQLNNKMLVLAAFAAVFLPLTFVTGLFGMNVGGIPWGVAHHGFFTVCLILAFIGAATVLLLRLRHWI
jgi:zinc transporter